MEPEKRLVKETSSLSQSRKGPKTCYGATRNPKSPTDYKLVTHNLTLTDTLQGLAIKYGVSVSTLRPTRNVLRVICVFFIYKSCLSNMWSVNKLSVEINRLVELSFFLKSKHSGHFWPAYCNSSLQLYGIAVVFVRQSQDKYNIEWQPYWCLTCPPGILH